MDNQQINQQLEGQSQVQQDNVQQPQQGSYRQPQQGSYQQPQQGSYQQPQQPPVLQPSSHLGLAILTTICCCLPLGIVAIIKGNDVGKLYAAKQYDAAMAASNEAKKWCIYGIVAYFVIGAILGLIGLIGGAAALSFLPFSDSLQSIFGG